MMFSPTSTHFKNHYLSMPLTLPAIGQETSSMSLTLLPTDMLRMIIAFCNATVLARLASMNKFIHGEIRRINVNRRVSR